MLCHAGPYGEAAGLSQEAEGAREKHGPDLDDGFRRRNGHSRTGKFNQV